MAGSQRVFREKIAATSSLEKIFRAMELIAASRIGKARRLAQAAEPYTLALTRAVSAVASHEDDIDHPLLKDRHDTERVAVLVLAADRGLAGAYNANALREAERLVAKLVDEGRQVDLYVTGRRGIEYFDFRGHAMAKTWQGESDAPTRELANEIADTLLGAFLEPEADAAISQMHVVFTRFKNMVTQVPHTIRMLPLEVVEGEVAGGGALPLYDFEPSPEEVLDALLPRYIRSRIYDCLLQAAASELAARQRAMHTATDNAEDLIRDYTRLANQARQGEITQEITEIVSGADALAAS